MDMNDDALLRYSRQIMLPYFGIEGQTSLLDSTALLMGIGGLGSPMAMYLAAAGVGHLILCDFDRVEFSNLQRQIIHNQHNLGQLKTASATESITALNTDVKVTQVTHKLGEAELTEYVQQADIVLEGTDNFDSRFLTNKVCVAQKTPFISGAASRMEGQILSFQNDPGSPCLQCVFPDHPDAPLTCSENGILAPVAGIIGSIQATEAIKLLAMSEPLAAKILLIDAHTMAFRSMQLKKDPQCPICQFS